MNLLLIDISNTRTKIALADGTVVGKKFSLPTSDLSETYLRDLLAAEKIDDPSIPALHRLQRGSREKLPSRLSLRRKPYTH